MRCGDESIHTPVATTATTNTNSKASRIRPQCRLRRGFFALGGTGGCCTTGAGARGGRPVGGGAAGRRGGGGGRPRGSRRGGGAGGGRRAASRVVPLSTAPSSSHRPR